MRWLLIVPVVHEPWARACWIGLAQANHPEGCQLRLVDNTWENAGVPAAWNQGIDQCERDGHDWLVLCSAAIRWGTPGGSDMHEVLCSTDPDGVWAVEASYVGWHLIAFPMSTLRLVGRFDENFHPAYYEDNDYAYRIRLAEQQLGRREWPSVEIAAASAGHAHAVNMGLVRANPGECLAYYERKWGGPPGRETFTHPYNDPALAWSDWRPEA